MADIALPYYASDSKEYRHIRYRINLHRFGMDYFTKKAMEWKKNNPEKVRNFIKKYNSTPESKEYRRQYHIKNREQIRQRKRQFYRENKDKLRKEKREYYQKNKEVIQVKNKRYYLDWKYYNRFQVIFHYSNGKMCCKNCGENINEFLTIDHINGNGNKHRKSIGYVDLYSWLRRNNFPDGYQILCYNCNLSKYRVTPKRYNEIIDELQKRQLSKNLINTGELS